MAVEPTGVGVHARCFFPGENSGGGSVEGGLSSIFSESPPSTGFTAQQKIVCGVGVGRAGRNCRVCAPSLLGV